MEDLGERLTGATAIAVLGVALTALFLGYDWFWMVFVIGYAVVLPLVAILTGVDDDDHEVDEHVEETVEDALETAIGRTTSTGDDDVGSTQDALELLRERYARGELSDDQFDRKLDRLLETETLEDARDVARGTDDARPVDGRAGEGRTVDRERAADRE